MHKLNKKLAGLVSVVLLALPVIAFAYPGIINKDTFIKTVLPNILALVSTLVGVLIIVMFLYIGFLFLSVQGEANKISEAKKALLWGIVGVIVCILAAGMVIEIARILQITI